MKRKREIETMLKEIQRRGGIVGGLDNLSDEMAERFLEKILNCPDCIEEGKRQKAPRPTDH